MSRSKPDTRHKAPTVYQYDYQDCKALRYKGTSWRKLGIRYGRHHSTINERFNRDTEAERIKIKTTNRINKKDHRANGGNLKSYRYNTRQTGKPINNQPENLTDLEIIQIPYGHIEPTLHTSELSHDEWIDKFIMYDYYTIDPEAIKVIQEQWRTEYLTTMRNELWDEDELLVLLPRGYGKTETVIALYLRWYLEVRKPLYKVAPSYSHNKDDLRRMVHILKSPAIRRVYGDIIGVASFDRERLTMTYHDMVGYVSLDPPVSMTTWNSAKEGPHPAWLVFDDVMQKDYKNIESNDDIKWKYSKTFAKMRTRRDGKRTRVSVIGTRYGMEDMYSYFMNIHKFKVLHYRALNEDGTWLYCPNYTLDDLLIEREKDVASFETTMNNNPIPSTGIYFNAESWKEIEMVECASCTFRHHPWVHEKPFYYMALDPARGMSDSADNTAIIVFAILNGVGMVVDGYVGHADDVKMMKEFDHLYNEYFPVFSLVEKTFAQIDMNRFNQYRGIIPYQDTVEKAKIMRINAMKTHFTDGLIIVVKQDSKQDKEEGKPYQFIYNEYLSYNQTPSTPSRKDDAIDALAMIIQHAGQYLEKYIATRTDWSEVTDFHLTA